MSAAPARTGLLAGIRFGAPKRPPPPRDDDGADAPASSFGGSDVAAARTADVASSLIGSADAFDALLSRAPREDPAVAARAAAAAAAAAAREAGRAVATVNGLYDPKRDPSHAAYRGPPVAAVVGGGGDVGGGGSGGGGGGGGGGSDARAPPTFAAPAGAHTSSSAPPLSAPTLPAAGGGGGVERPAWRERMLARAAGDAPRRADEPSPAPPPAPAPASAPARAPPAAAWAAAPTVAPPAAPLRAAPPAARPPPEAPTAPLASTASTSSTASLNSLHAALLRAQMVGDASRVAALTASIAAAGAAGEAPGAGGARKRARELDEGARGGASFAAPPVGGGAIGGGVTILSHLDARGMPIPSLSAPASASAASREDFKSGRRAGKLAPAREGVDADGRRRELLAGDAAAASLSVAELARREAAVGAGDLDAAIFANAVRAGGRLASALVSDARGADEGDDGAVVDAGRLVAAPDARLTDAERRRRDVARAALGASRADAALARCALCVESAAFAARTAGGVLAVGEHCYVALPPEGARLPRGRHLVIVPFAHAPSLTAASEEAWAEVNAFKAAITAMARAHGAGGAGGGGGGGGGGGRGGAIDVLPPPGPGVRRPALLAGDVDADADGGGGGGGGGGGADDDDGPLDAVFVETALHVGTPGGARGGAAGLAALAPPRARHACAHALLLPAAAAADAPIFFRKALLDAAGDDGTNRAVIDTAGRGLRRCVPPGFSYVHVSWAGGGLAHPVEDDDAFPRDLALDVAVGIADGGAAPGRFGRREAARAAVRVTPEDARELARRWAPHDFTGGRRLGQ